MPTIESGLRGPSRIDNVSIISLGGVEGGSARVGVHKEFRDQTDLRGRVCCIEPGNLARIQNPVPEPYSGQATLKEAAKVLGSQPERGTPGPWFDHELDVIVWGRLMVNRAGPLRGPAVRVAPN